MKKVAIVTIESMNFGNRLQNYALHQVLKFHDYYVKTLHRNHIVGGCKANLKRCVQNILQTKKFL